MADGMLVIFETLDLGIIGILLESLIIYLYFDSKFNESITYNNARLLCSLEEHIYYKQRIKKVCHKNGRIHKERHYF